MRQLDNIESDKQFLQGLLSKGEKPKATFTLGGFTDTELVTVDYVGRVTEIDLKSGYCRWENEQGLTMPVVNINCITLH